jgi:hypothetical protein
VEFNIYRPSGTSVPANVLLFGRAVQRLYRCVIPLLKASSKHKFKTIVVFECLEFFYWLLRLSEIDFLIKFVIYVVNLFPNLTLKIEEIL